MLDLCVAPVSASPTPVNKIVGLSAGCNIFSIKIRKSKISTHSCNLSLRTKPIPSIDFVLVITIYRNLHELRW